jgi:AcrR family transcriptional regulator
MRRRYRRGHAPDHRAPCSRSRIYRTRASIGQLEVYETVPYGSRMVRGKAREDAILHATLEQLAERGYDALTIDEVASRASASKATIYRRWRNKAELVRAALDALDAREAEIAETGSLRSDLLAVVDGLRQKATARYLAMIQDLMLAAKRDPALAKELDEHVATEQLSPFHRVLERHVRPDAVDFQLVHDVAEAMVLRQIQAGKRLDPAFARRLVDDVLLPLIDRAPRSRRR